MIRIRLIFILLVLFLLSQVGMVLAAENVVSLGADLSAAERDQILKLFNVSEDEVVRLFVTNEEEKAYLKDLVPAEKIGTKAISSAYVEGREKGSGITVETYNINWITKEMYANALVTAGVEDARVVVAAPFAVSGTAALTGVMKAFEKATGKNISEESKKTANEELVVTGELGDQVGTQKAAALVKEIKERVVQKNLKDPQDIRKVIIDVAAELNISLSEAQINQIIDLMKRIQGLDLSLQNITSQLQSIGKSLDSVKKAVEDNQGILQRILDALQSFIRWIQGLFS